MSIFAFALYIIFNIDIMNIKANPYYNAYEYNLTFGSDSCRLAVVEGEGRIYFGAYGKKVRNLMQGIAQLDGRRIYILMERIKNPFTLV